MLTTMTELPPSQRQNIFFSRIEAKHSQIQTDITLRHGASEIPKQLSARLSLLIEDRIKLTHAELSSWE
jgi:hypothetical protein